MVKEPVKARNLRQAFEEEQMDSSEEQFQELIAQLLGRVNRMLAARSDVLPMGLLLMPDGKLDVSVAVHNSVEQIRELFAAMQESLSEKVRQSPAIASCIACLDIEARELVAYLENRDNACITVRIPLAGRSAVTVDLKNITVEDGSLSLFPVNG